MAHYPSGVTLQKLFCNTCLKKAAQFINEYTTQNSPSTNFNWAEIGWNPQIIYFTIGPLWQETSLFHSYFFVIALDPLAIAIWSHPSICGIRTGDIVSHCMQMTLTTSHILSDVISIGSGYFFPPFWNLCILCDHVKAQKFNTNSLEPNCSIRHLLWF